MTNETIAALNAAFYDDYGEHLDPRSIAFFQQFAWMFPHCRQAALSANADGSIVAVWRQGPESVALAFVPNTLLYADSLVEQEFLRHHGTIPLADIPSMPFYRLMIPDSSSLT